jgi:hypothetical protein
MLTGNNNWLKLTGETNPMNEEKERMKDLCAPVYEWVKSMK